MTKTVLGAALAALLAVPAAAGGAGPAKTADVAAKPAPKVEARPERRITLDLRAATYAGGFDGFGVRRESGGVAILEASAKPELNGERWVLDVPFRVSHRETFDANLSETAGSFGVEPWYVVSKKARLGIEAGILGAYRPNWPDLYNTDPSDPTRSVLPPTDRYSYFAWRGGAQLYARPAPHQHVRGRYRYVDYDYVQDADFTVVDVMHLTPRDRTEHQVEASWRYRQQRWDFGFLLDYTFREYKTLLSRQASSGSSDINNVPNPKQQLAVWEPAAELAFETMRGILDVTLRYGIDVWDDPFQGYYSLTAHNPKIRARLAVTERLGAAATLEGWYATYSINGSSRLEPGATRRKDSRTEAKGELDYRLGGGLALQAKIEWVTRSTNYLDFLPPSEGGTSSFNIEFDYTNFRALAGIEYKL